MRAYIPALGTALSLLLLAGCAREAPESAGGESVLARELAGLSAGPPRTCVSASSATQNLVAIDENTIIQREGRTVWVNRLRARCPGLRPPVTVIVQTHGSQHCRGDHIRALEFGGSIPGPTCFLGDWTPYRPG